MVTSDSVPALISVNDRHQIDWELQQDLNRKLNDINLNKLTNDLGPATPPPESQGSLVIDEKLGQSNDSNLEPPGTPPPNQQAATAGDGLPDSIPGSHPDSEATLQTSSTVFDPQGINQDLQQLSQNLDRSQWRVLHKLNAGLMNQGRDIESLQEQVGPHVSTTHYFLNGETEPQFFSNTHTISENIIGLKNSGLRTRRSLDSHVTKYNQDVQLLKSSVTSLKDQMAVKPTSLPVSSCPNAVPNADEILKYKEDLAKIQEELKKALAKASSLSNGSAFNTLDLSARMVELENANKKLSHRLECTSKAVGVLKNEKPSASKETDVLEFEIQRLRERVDQLEKEDSDRHSRNLFSDLSDSKISLLEKDVEELQKNARLQLADSETNLWLKRKLEAFLETPEMSNKFKSEFRTFSSTWTLQPRNLSTEVREMIVKVSLIC